jgi:ATP-binding cassette subfamily B protein
VRRNAGETGPDEIPEKNSANIGRSFMSQIPPILQKERTWLYLRLLANGLLQALAMAAVIFLVRSVFDSIAPRRGPVDLARVFWMGIVLACVGIARGLLAWRSRVDAAMLGQGYAQALRMSMYDRLSTMSPRSLARRSEGAVMLHFTGDVSAVRRWVTRGMARGMVSALTIGLALAVLAWLSWPLVVAVCVCLGLGLVLDYRPSRTVRKTIRDLRRARSHLMAAIGEQISAIATIQALGQSGRERRRFSRRIRIAVEASVAQARASGQLRAITRSAARLSRAAVLVVGASEVARGRTTLGTVAAAVTVVGLFSSRMRTLARAFVYYRKAKIARKKINLFFDTPSLMRIACGVHDLEPGDGRLEFEHVTLGDAVKDVCAAAEPGRRIALVGPNGAGKSTLLALACRLVDPDKGRVLLDDQDLAERSLESVHRAIGVASSDLPLLRGSISHNLRYRMPKIPADEFSRIQELCGLEDVLTVLPEGLETHVIEGGRNLSLGQRQRIILARAVIGNPRVLLLDEIDSNIDEAGGRALDRVLAQFPGTVIIASHHPDRIARADAVWRMDGGSLVGLTQEKKT